MHDERAIADPDEFKVDRPWSDYMLFGLGLHTCYGQQIVRNQLPAMMTALLEGPTIERAPARPATQVGRPVPVEPDRPLRRGLTARQAARQGSIRSIPVS